jgi:hypothetical protein
MTAKDQDRSAEELELGKETIKDLDVPAGKAKDVKGGATGGCPHPEHTVAKVQVPTNHCTA